MTYEALSLSGGAAHQLGCMLLDDRSLLTLEVFEGATLPQIPKSTGTVFRIHGFHFKIPKTSNVVQ